MILIFRARIEGLLRVISPLLPRKRILMRPLIRRIFMYSARKRRVKSIEEYSTLNPETSSDSLSVRSKGVRLVSASLLIISIMNAGNSGRKYQE